MSVKNFIQISAVPGYQRARAQQRMRQDRIIATPLSNNQFRVRASGASNNVLSRHAVLNLDYYSVQTFDSDGELFATCTCPFGQKGEDGDQNICKHIEAALVARPAAVGFSAPKARALPEFGNGSIVIKIDRNVMTVSSSAQQMDGSEFLKPAMRSIRLRAGTGVVAYNKLLEFIDDTF